MVGVFSIFATLPIVDMKEMGIGLAAAVLIDATIVRAVLLPATMKLLGDWNWYLPNWLELAPDARSRRRRPGSRYDGRLLRSRCRPELPVDRSPLNVWAAERRLRRSRLQRDRKLLRSRIAGLGDLQHDVPRMLGLRR